MTLEEMIDERTKLYDRLTVLKRDIEYAEDREVIKYIQSRISIARDEIHNLQKEIGRLGKVIERNENEKRVAFLIERIKNSLPERKMLHVVSFAGVEINGEIVELKNRFSGLVPNDLITYNESFYKPCHDLEAIRNKNIIFGIECFSRTGLLAMLEFGMLEGKRKTGIVNDFK